MREAPSGLAQHGGCPFDIGAAQEKTAIGHLVLLLAMGFPERPEGECLPVPGRPNMPGLSWQPLNQPCVAGTGCLPFHLIPLPSLTLPSHQPGLASIDVIYLTLQGARAGGVILFSLSLPRALAAPPTCAGHVPGRVATAQSGETAACGRHASQRLLVAGTDVSLQTSRMMWWPTGGGGGGGGGVGGDFGEDIQDCQPMEAHM